MDKLRLLADGDVTDEVATIPVGARSWLIVSEMPASTEFEIQHGAGQQDIDESKEFRGWGTWIRTKAARSRAGSSTAKLSPNGAAGRGNNTPAPAQATSGRFVPRGAG